MPGFKKRLQLFAISLSSLAVISISCGTLPEEIVGAEEIKEHVQYLASDALKGRNTGTPGLDSAASYIAVYFKEKKIQPPTGQNSFRQQVNIRERPREVTVSLLFDGYTVPPEDILYLQGSARNAVYDLSWIDFRNISATEASLVQNKLVITDIGIKYRTQIADYLLNPNPNRDQLVSLGAKGLVEVYEDEGSSWRRLKKYSGMLGMYLDKGHAYNEFLHVVIRGQQDIPLTGHGYLRARLAVNNVQPITLTSYNIVGIIPGTHPAHKDEYILLTAHYDHIGVGKPIERLNGEIDSIYNGARDNAVGTAALMLAGRVLAKFPTDRSVILMACTAEEAGLLGSSWYVEHPLVPLNKTVFNLNIDGAGYNDTDIATVIGLNRTTATPQLTRACRKFGLEAFTSPEIEEQLYKRSDNIVFAQAGIPSITFSMGLRQFDSRIRDYYHQPTDEADRLDYDYLEKWTKALICAVRMIANMEQPPEWNVDGSAESPSTANHTTHK